MGPGGDRTERSEPVPLPLPCSGRKLSEEPHLHSDGGLISWHPATLLLEGVCARCTPPVTPTHFSARCAPSKAIASNGPQDAPSPCEWRHRLLLPPLCTEEREGHCSGPQVFRGVGGSPGAAREDACLAALIWLHDKALLPGPTSNEETAQHLQQQAGPWRQQQRPQGDDAAVGTDAGAAAAAAQQLSAEQRKQQHEAKVAALRRQCAQQEGELVLVQSRLTSALKALASARDGFHVKETQKLRNALHQMELQAQEREAFYVKEMQQLRNANCRLVQDLQMRMADLAALQETCNWMHTQQATSLHMAQQGTRVYQLGLTNAAGMAQAMPPAAMVHHAGHMPPMTPMATPRPRRILKLVRPPCTPSGSPPLSQEGDGGS